METLTANATRHRPFSLGVRQQAILQRVLGPDIQFEADRVILGAVAYSIVGGVVRFRDDDGYNASFAKQWKQFQLNQYDRFNGTTLYQDRFRRETGWPTSGLNGELILEAGCGAGAFTCHLAATGADVVSIDYSSAVEVAADHNAGERTLFAQADILDLPFAPGVFDRVYCHGVLQHTPNPRAAFVALTKHLRPGGNISIDIYRKDFILRPHKAKYFWRWLTTRMDHGRLLRLIAWYVPKWLPVDTRIKRIRVFRNLAGAIIPCMNYDGLGLSAEQQVQWAIMNTFDALAPKYDFPVRLRTVRRWFQTCGFKDFEVRPGGNGIVANGIKPHCL